MEAFISEGVQLRVIDLLILALPKWKLFIYTFFIIVSQKPQNKYQNIK